MIKKIVTLKLIILNILLTTNLFSENNREVFFMPYESKIALEKMVSHIDVATKSIDIAIYSFTFKKIAKKLKKASKRGVKIEIISDEKSNERKGKHSQIANLAKIKNINCYFLRDKYRDLIKMHNKFMLIDDKIVIYGSTNLSKKSFSKHFETLFIEKNSKLTKKFKNYFDKMKNDSEAY